MKLEAEARRAPSHSFNESMHQELLSCLSPMRCGAGYHLASPHTTPSHSHPAQAYGSLPRSCRSASTLGSSPASSPMWPARPFARLARKPPMPQPHRARGSAGFARGMYFDKAWSALTDPLASTRLRQGSSVDESQMRLGQQRLSVLYLA